MGDEAKPSRGAAKAKADPNNQFRKGLELRPAMSMEELVGGTKPILPPEEDELLKPIDEDNEVSANRRPSAASVASAEDNPPAHRSSVVSTASAAEEATNKPSKRDS